MASNRVERLQMRQRGAGTRKIKEVDFGFSLGFGPPAEESSQPASQPTNSDLNPTPAPQAPLLDAPPPDSAPSTTETTQTRSTPSPARTNAFAASQNQPLRSPGSARNKFPPRRSTFDIPADDNAELERSNKRRKIDLPSDNAPPSGAQTETPSDAPHNGATETPIQALDKGRTISIRTITSNQAPLPDQEPAADVPSIPIIGTDETPPEVLNGGPEHVGTENAARLESPRVNGTASPPANSSEGSRRGKGGRPSPSQDDVSNLESAEAVSQEAVEHPFTESPQPAEAAHEPDSHEHGVPETRDKQTRNRRLVSGQPAEQPTVAEKAPSKHPSSEPIEALQDQRNEYEPLGTQEKRTRRRSPALTQSSREYPGSDKPAIEGAGSGRVGAPQATEAQEVDATRTQDKRRRSRTTASIQHSIESPATGKVTYEEAILETVPSGTAGKGVRGRKRKNLEPTDGAASTRPESDEPSATLVEDEVAADSVTTRENPDSSEDQPNGVGKGKKRAGRPKKQAKPPPPSEEPATSRRKRQHEEERDQAETRPGQEQPVADTARAVKGEKQRKEREPSPRQEEQAEPEPEIEESRARKRRKGREEREPTPQAERTEPDAATKVARAGRSKQQRQERSPEQEQPAPEPEVEQAHGRGRKRQEKQVPAAEQEEQLGAEPETGRVRADRGKKRQDHVPTAEQEEQQEREPEIEREPQSGQRPKDTKRGGKRSAAQPEEPPGEDATEDQPQPTKRKPRQPRGETVPVTVHRLANAALLGGEPLEPSDEDDASSPDDLTSKQITKLPSRGGVNPADVLAQICRETLEKTLTTLKTGIENEANATRRAEWTLRRKAVEAFGAELEGRLFDLSEMLDSNFMLSAKVKKAKRNMLDLRARLDRVRREREAVALRMDAVRREHAREEQAGMARSTINHSLHNLDLALERGQNRTSTIRHESPTAGLELRLRSLARSVSSSAPGSQGGILSQIKSLNAQLEATARRLER